MDGRCATCQWWEPFPRTPHVVDGYCHLLSEPNQEQRPVRKAVAIGSDLALGTLTTLSDFGCVQWQAKEGE